MPLLEISNLTVYYGKIRALHNVAISVGESEIVAVIGRNGAGKTTLLKSIMGLIDLKEGNIKFSGEDITRKPAWERANMGIGYVPEGRRLFPYLTVYENLLMGAYTIKDKETINRNLERVFTLFPRLRERKKQLAKTLSGGEGEMLAIGRGLMSNAKLLLMDEPSFGLAPIIIENVYETIKRLKSEGITILLVEQNAKKALEVADKCYVLDQGEIVYSADAVTASKDPNIKKLYLGA